MGLRSPFVRILVEPLLAWGVRLPPADGSSDRSDKQRRVLVADLPRSGYRRSRIPTICRLPGRLVSGRRNNGAWDPGRARALPSRRCNLSPAGRMHGNGFDSAAAARRPVLFRSVRRRRTYQPPLVQSSSLTAIGSGVQCETMSMASRHDCGSQSLLDKRCVLPTKTPSVLPTGPLPMRCRAAALITQPLT